jgi:hypothetical protein
MKQTQLHPFIIVCNFVNFEKLGIQNATKHGNSLPVAPRFSHNPKHPLGPLTK